MTLTDVQARQVLERPLARENMHASSMYESAMRVFTEPMDESELMHEKYWTHLNDVLKKRLSKKYKRVHDFIRFPLPVTQITDSVINDFFKVFDGKNKYFNVSSDREIVRLKEWLHNNKIEQWVEDNAKKVLLNKPCSFVVIDKDEKGNPYPILIGSKRLIDAKYNDEGDKLLYIAFKHSHNHYAVYDEQTYYVFEKSSNQDHYILVSQNQHNLGYCPATPFISECVNDRNPFKRRSAFGNCLSLLEDWTIFDIFRNYVDHYAPFPVTEAVKPKCPNPDCNDGMVETTETVLNSNREPQEIVKRSKCQVCDGGHKMFAGPGTHIPLTFTLSKEDNDGSGKFRMIFPETDKLKYTPEKLDALELEIRLKTVGVSEMAKQAVNELQVKGSFAQMDSVLLRVKGYLDHVYVFIANTVGKLLYPNALLRVEANYGTEWYLVSEEDLQKRFENAKKIGLPINEVKSIYKQLVETKYANNKSKRDRELMLIDIQNYPFYSIEECIKLKNESVIDDFELSLKSNFDTFLARFERENGTITMFGINKPYNNRIQAIQQTLIAYNSQLFESKIKRANPEGSNDEEKPISQEQLDAQANLRGTVGGVQGIIQLQQSMAAGTTSLESAVTTMVEIYGFDDEKARRILGKPTAVMPTETEII